MPKATWRDERAASMRYIAKSYLRKGDLGQARDWYFKAIAEAPYMREPYLDLAMLLYEQGIWEGVLYVTGCALEITVRPRSYICEAEAWGSLLHDLRAIAFFRTGRNQAALEEARLALAQEPGNLHIQKNVAALEQAEQQQ